MSHITFRFDNMEDYQIESHNTVDDAIASNNMDMNVVCQRTLGGQ